MGEHHYLGFHSLTGNTLKYVALLEGQWVALIGWGSAALHIIPKLTIMILDIDLIVDSVKKTGRLVVADPDWPCSSFSEHVAATVSRRAFDILKCPVQCVTLPDAPVPSSTPLERAYFPNCANIVDAVKQVGIGVRSWG